MEQISKIMESIEQIRGKLITMKPILEQVIVKKLMTFNEESQQYEDTSFEIDKETLHRIIKQITIHKRTKEGQLIDVLLVNGKEFQLTFKPKRMTILKSN
jgi:hypothetical protein